MFCSFVEIKVQMMKNVKNLVFNANIFLITMYIFYYPLKGQASHSVVSKITHSDVLGISGGQ